MSKIKSLLPEDYEPEIGNDYPPEQAEQDTKAEQAEAEQKFALWNAVSTLKPYLWEIDLVVGGVRFNGLMLSEAEPDPRQAAAVIATRYSQGVSEASRLIDQIRNGEATVLMHRPTIFDTDSIKDNYIPF